MDCPAVLLTGMERAKAYVGKRYLVLHICCVLAALLVVLGLSVGVSMSLLCYYYYYYYCCDIYIYVSLVIFLLQ